MSELEAICFTPEDSKVHSCVSDSESDESTSDSEDSEDYEGRRTVTTIVEDLKPSVANYLFNMVRFNKVDISKVHRSFHYEKIVNIKMAWSSMGIFYDYLIRKELYNLKNEDAYDHRASFEEKLYCLLTEIKTHYPEQISKVKNSKIVNSEDVKEGTSVINNKCEKSVEGLKNDLEKESNDRDETDSNKEQKTERETFIEQGRNFVMLKFENTEKKENDAVNTNFNFEENNTKEITKNFNDSIDQLKANRDIFENNDPQQSIKEKNSADEDNKTKSDVNQPKSNTNDVDEEIVETTEMLMLKDYFRNIRRTLHLIRALNPTPEKGANTLKLIFQYWKYIAELIFDYRRTLEYMAINFEHVGELIQSYHKYMDKKNKTLDIIQDIYNSSMFHMIFFGHPYAFYDSRMINEFNIKAILRYLKTMNLNNILINPAVGCKYFYGDADVITEDTVMDIKTSKFLSLRKEHKSISKTAFYQLIFYGLGLYIKEKREIRRFLIYNPLLGFEYLIQIPNLNYPEFFALVDKEAPL